MLPNLGPGEIAILLIIALIVFGPKKLPEIGKNIGNAFREFNRAKTDFMESLNAEPERETPAYTYDTHHEPHALDSGGHYPYEDSPTERPLEYPEPLAVEEADALPYGSDFHTVEGDSQPVFRTAAPELAAATSSTNGRKEDANVTPTGA